MVPVRLGSGNPSQVTPTFIRVKRARCHFYPAAFGDRFISQQPDWKPHIRRLAFPMKEENSPWLMSFGALKTWSQGRVGISPKLRFLVGLLANSWLLLAMVIGPGLSVTAGAVHTGVDAGGPNGGSGSTPSYGHGNEA